MSTDLIVFELEERRCALELEVVREVIPLGPVTPVPAAPAAIVGAVNVHGQVVAVVDLGPLLGLPSTARPRPGASGVLAAAADAVVVLLVTRVCEVVPAELGAPPEGDAIAQPVATALGEILLVDLARTIEELQRTIRQRPQLTREKLEPGGARTGAER